MARVLMARRMRIPWYAAPLVVGALVLTALCAGDGAHAADVQLTRLVQATDSPVADALGRLGYLFGATDVTVGLAILLGTAFAAHGHRAEAALLFATALTRGLNPSLKALADSPRPSSEVVAVAEHASGLGFPSSHAMGVVLLFGAVAHVAHRLVQPRSLRLGIQAAAGAAVLTTGFGRVYTGAHWPSDVLGGYLWGLVWLIALIAAYRVLRLVSRDSGVRSDRPRSDLPIPVLVRSESREGAPVRRPR